jgi:hypothetical protein
LYLALLSWALMRAVLQICTGKVTSRIRISIINQY